MSTVSRQMRDRPAQTLGVDCNVASTGSCDQGRNASGRNAVMTNGPIRRSKEIAGPRTGMRERYRQLTSSLASLLTFHGDALGYTIARRILDLVASSCILVLTSPLLLIIAALIKMDSPGPVLFRHVRTGIDRRRKLTPDTQGVERRREDLFGERFTLYKFRTMYMDAKTRFPELYTYEYSLEELENLPIKILVGQKQAPTNREGREDALINNDPRLTRVGRWLRRTSLDELPNLFNVLKGDMHLVGPRPDIFENIRYYPEPHRQILRVKPGVTGLAQTQGRGKLTFIQTNEADLEYVTKRSFALDLKILLRTLVVTLNGDGAL